MVEPSKTGILEQILELLDTACQASIELIGQLGLDGNIISRRLLDDLCTVVATIEDAQQSLLEQLGHAYTGEMLENIGDTLKNVLELLDANDHERATMLAEFQLLPFLRQLREAFYFWGTVYPDEERMGHYYREEFAEHYRNLYVIDDEPLPYRLSVIVTGYNHLETTKQCIKQLLKETNFEKLNAELILIDHGSTDGTLEYFENLGIGKVIHFKRNVRMNMFATVLQVCRSDYFCFVSNDVLVSRNWAENLLSCMDSDESIILAAPATPYTSNLQWTQFVPDTPKKFLAWADKQNIPDSTRWNDRTRVMPNLGMYRLRAVNRIGYADPLFYSMEFWDDDFSLRARRAGYRQVVCDDTACYHYGSVTGKEAQKKENTLVYGRALFQKKNNVDAWGNGFCYDYTSIQILRKLFSTSHDLSFLCVDCGFGDTPLQIKNELRHLHRDCTVYQITSQKEFVPDQNYLTDRAYYIPNLLDECEKELDGAQFNCIYLGRDIAQYDKVDKLVKMFSGLLVPNGFLVMYCDNPFFAPRVQAMLQFSLPDGKEHFSARNPEHVEDTLNTYFSQTQVLPQRENIQGMKDFIGNLYGCKGKVDETVNKMNIKRFYYVCFK